MNIPLCNGGPVTRHDFDLLVPPSATHGFAFPYMRTCVHCGTLEVVIRSGHAVYFTPWQSPPEETGS